VRSSIPETHEGIETARRKDRGGRYGSMSEMKFHDPLSKFEYWVIRLVLSALVIGGAYRILDEEFHIKQFIQGLAGNLGALF
jgi:hypothetical protein